MFSAFFAVAAVSPTRQRGFRRAVLSHLLLLLALTGWLCHRPPNGGAILGYVLLTAGIAEGAVLAGWRLTQLPKTQALEFLLVSPLRPAGVFLAEALVGLCRLTLVTLSGLPVLVVLVSAGVIDLIDLVPFLLMPLTWGAVAGLALTAWAYEPANVRRWAERIILAWVVVYLVVGVLAGEHLAQWIAWLPTWLGQFLLGSLAAFHRYNPFSILHDWMSEGCVLMWERTLAVEIVTVALVGALLARAAGRLHGHFHDRHYRPARPTAKPGTPLPVRHGVGDRPLSWWAVRRVTEYSGRVNLWLAGGFGLLYALYTVAGPHWPAWLGRRVFLIFDDAGGVPVWATALVVLAAVPAAFQYGLWDSNAQERSRRLELLLLTRLTAADYWHAAAAAAWRRGRGYFIVAGVLWAAAAIASPAGIWPAVAGLAAGVLLWGLYFALGFWAFSRGLHANNLGLGLTVGLPALAYGLRQLGWPQLAGLLPPGCVHGASTFGPNSGWLLGAAASALIMLLVTRRSLTRCEELLRGWYDRHHGALVPG
jgi:hypothetical protein